MGFYVNPDDAQFRECLNSEIYVDKTLLLRELNRRMSTDGKFVCVSRPRRFGKTMAGSMITAYYSKGCDSKELFSGLDIAQDPDFGMRLNKFNCLRIDVNSFLSDYDCDAISRMKSEVMNDFRREFADVDFSSCSTIADCIREAYGCVSIPFVVIIDEYDAILREGKSQAMVEDYLRFLNALFKSSTTSSCIALAYLTGILPIIREKAQSKPNNFEEITFLELD